MTLYFALITRVKDKDKGQDKKYYKEKGNFFKKYIRGSLYRNIDSFLKESGYKVSIEFYIFIHLLTAGLIIFYTLVGFERGFEKSATINLRLLMLMLVFNLMIYMAGKKRKEKLLLELSRIQEVMYFQSKIGVSEDVVLINAAAVSKEPLRSALEDLAAAYRFKKDIDRKLEEFRSISNLTEIQTFSFILEQRRLTGKAEESHKAQSYSLKKNRRLTKKIKRQNKRTKLIMASLLLFGCYVLMMTGPLISHVMRSFDSIFK